MFNAESIKQIGYKKASQLFYGASGEKVKAYKTHTEKSFFQTAVKATGLFRHFGCKELKNKLKVGTLVSSIAITLLTP